MTEREKLQKKYEHERLKREERIAAHLCYTCGAALPDDQHKRCPRCRERNIRYLKDYYKQRKAEGACVCCGKIARQGHTTCFACALKQSEHYERKKLTGGMEK